MIESVLLFLCLNINLISNPQSKLKKIIQALPVNCVHEFKNDSILTITQRDTFYIQFCGVSSLKKEVVDPYTYEITIEVTKRIYDQEIKRRIFLQDSLLQVLKFIYETNNTKSNQEEYNWFLFNRNEIDSLRVPVYSDRQHSYFYKSNFPKAYCFVEKQGKTKDQLITLDIERLLKSD
jgi:hypothetical protein